MFGTPSRVFVSTAPCDMRAGIGTLSMRVAGELGRDPADGSLYVFVSRDATKAKMLRCEGGAECLYYVRLAERVMLANVRAFCPKADRVSPGQLSLFNDFEAAADPAAPEPEPPAQARPRRRGGKRRLDLSSLETVVVDLELPEGERFCEACGSGLEEIAVEVTRTVRLVPARLVVEERRRRVYRCPACSAAAAAGEEGLAPIAKAPAPALPIPGSIASPSLLAWVLHAKYVNAMPLYRIEADFASLGLPLSRANMANKTRIGTRSASGTSTLPPSRADTTSTRCCTPSTRRCQRT